MVRADDQSGRKPSGHLRKKSSMGKSGPEPYNAPLWPCEINGCGKQFVREADLRRHQRTTKVHANPNYVCGECGASFTRTDALKRHEKSKSHVAQGPSQNSSVFIEDSATTTSAETKAASTSSELSTRSRSSRSLSPGPSREKEKERRERERRLGDRELPPLRAPTSSRYYRPHTAMTTPYEQPPAPSNSQPAVSFSRLQTHSSSLNAILASPISTPRLHPANWSLPSSGQSKAPPPYNNGYVQTPPPPPLPPSSSKPSNGHYVPHYRYPHSPPRMVSQLLAQEHPTSSREPVSPSSVHEVHTPRGQLDTRYTTSTARADSSSKSNESITSSDTTTIRRKESSSLTLSPSPGPLARLAAPPIAASTELPLTLATLTDDDSNSSDSDETEEPDEEVDELESTDSENELAEPEDAVGPNSAGARLENLVPIKPVAVEEETRAAVTASGHSVPDIHIEACIDPVATGITEEEVKAAMDDMRKQELEQAEQQQQQHLRQDKAENDAHGGPLGALGMGIGIGIRASSTGVDHDGSPFLSEIVLSSPSSLTVNDVSVVHGTDSQTRRGGHSRSSDSSVNIPDVRQSPGSGRGLRTRESDDEWHSPSSLLGDPHGDLDQNFHRHHPNPRHHSYESHDKIKGAGSRLDESDDVDMKTVYDIVDVNVGGDIGVGGRLSRKAANERVKTNAMDVDGINDLSGSNSLQGHNRRHRRDVYGGGDQDPSPSLDRSLSLSPLDQYHHAHHHRYSRRQNSHSIIDEADGDEQHTLHHRHTHHLHHQHHPAELLAQVTMPL